MTEDVAQRIGESLNRSSRMVKFNALRMMLEVLRGEHLPMPIQKRLWNRAEHWTPEREY